jgi:tol-pal system protein YbgF
MRHSFLALAATLTLAFSGAAFAQDDDGEESIAPVAAPIASGGRMEVRISKLEQEIRALRGVIEQQQFTERQLATEMKKLSDDMEYRLRALEEKQAAAATIAAPAPIPAAPQIPMPTSPVEEPAKFDPVKKPEAAAPTVKPVAAVTGNDFPDANAHYSSAFKMLNEKKYSEAATSFDGFVKKYPSDPLTSNAYYWLGESYYARADYTRAAESFRKGFETGPSSQKAPDNLYKLAKSLNQVKRANEACLVLAQIIKKYPDAAPRTVKLAEDERLAMQCK